MAKKITKVPGKIAARTNSNGRDNAAPTKPVSSQRSYTILDYRLEKPRFDLRQVRVGDTVRYEVKGDMSAPAPPIRDSKYLDKKQCIEIYRFMLLNRKMESRSKISTSRAKSSAEFISDSARKPAPAPPPTRSVRTTGSRP
jgi:hypothetical protein